MRTGIRRGDGAAGRRLRRHVGAAAVMALALLTAACTGSGHSTSRVSPAANTTTRAAAPRPATAVPEVKITPANGAADADPSAGITVTATGGTLKNVTVRTSGDAVSGGLSQGGKVWRSQWALDVSQAYTVTAVASRTGGSTVTATSTFRTLTPGRTFTTEILEGFNQTYGVGMPIILYFSQPITDKAAVERALQITTSKPVVGAWYWDYPCNMAATCAYFRPRDYWPAGTTVSFTGHLNGVQAAPGLYGYHTLTQTFDIGPSLVAVGNTATHRTPRLGPLSRTQNVALGLRDLWYSIFRPMSSSYRRSVTKKFNSLPFYGTRCSAEAPSCNSSPVGTTTFHAPFPILPAHPA